MTAIALLAALTALVLGLGVLELRLHRRNLDRIPIRVHVNGTRGKSSVARLITAGLQAGGVPTFGKITGTLPILMLPDGREVPLRRRGRANIIEQRDVVRQAAGLGARALVVECMALQPYLQWLSESKLIQATLGVITNVRADHLDVMGPGEVDVAKTLASFMPPRHPTLTAEHHHVPTLLAAARDRAGELEVVSPEAIAAIDPADLARFGYIEHAENVALALATCERLGVDRKVALDGMVGLPPDPGAALAFELPEGGRRLVFVSAFAANDPESTLMLWRLARARYPELTTTVALFNCRADRADRSRQLAEALPGWPPADHVGLIGTGTHIFARHAVRAGLPAPHVLAGEAAGPDEVLEALAALDPGDLLVVGMGNIGGIGLRLVHLLTTRSQPS